MARHMCFAFACNVLALALAGIAPQAFAQEETIMPMPINREELARRLGEADISTTGVAAIVSVARDAIVLDSELQDEAKLPIGSSKVGGLPDLPKDMSWPVRPAYDGAAALKAQYDTDAANLYADADLLPPWMSKEDGTALIAERKRLNDEARTGALALMKEAGVDIGDFDLSNIPRASPDEISLAAREQRALGEAVTKSFPLTFMAQIDLAALSAEPGFDKVLPSHGRLLFFYDLPVLPASYEPGARSGWKLIHDQTAVADLERKALPQDLATFPGTVSLKSAGITPRSVVTTVPVGDAGWETVADVNGDDTSLYSEWLFSIGWPTEQAGGNHQLGGWPRAIQSGMQSTSQLAANGVDAGSGDAYGTEEGERLLADANAWRLVLQLGTDEAIGNPLPGALYVLMREEDLASLRFDKAWVIYEQD